MTTTTTNRRTTVSMEKAEHKALLKFAKENGWSVGKATTLAFDTLKTIMEAHEQYAKQYAPDVAALYLRVAREAPVSFVEVPKDGVQPGHLGDQPAVQLGNWVITDLGGDLMAEELDGERRLGKVVDGEVKPLRKPAAMTAAKFN